MRFGDSDLSAEPVRRQIALLDPASHRLRTDLQKLGGFDDGVEERGAAMCRVWLSSLVLILFSVGYELSGCLAGEEADKPHESSVMRGRDGFDSGRPFSDHRFRLSSMLIHGLARARAVP